MNFFPVIFIDHDSNIFSIIFEIFEFGDMSRQ